MIQLKILHDTIFTLQPVESSTLPDDAKQPISAGESFAVASYTQAGNDHFKVALANQFFKGHNTWFVYQLHVQLFENDQLVLPNTIQLPVPYLSQLDNKDNPFGSCNVTSIAMALMYLGVAPDQTNSDFADQLEVWMSSHGLDRHNPYDLAKAVQAHGAKDNFRTDATIKDVKAWLAQGNPATVHGYFTASGHVIDLIGYNDQGFIVNDPYGEWYTTGYDRNDSSDDHKGRGLTYSYDMIERTCMTGGQFWVHFISK
jgi:uncharacterized protein YvpB